MKNGNTDSFMLKRHGIDGLYMFMFIILTVLSVINIIFDLSFVTVVSLVVSALMIIRAMSKNEKDRAAENRAYLKILGKITQPFVKSADQKGNGKLEKREKDQ